MTIGIIPVKDISKGLPHKSFMTFNGMPLILRTARLLHPFTDKILITTDVPGKVQGVINQDLGIKNKIKLYHRHPMEGDDTYVFDTQIHNMLTHFDVPCDETLILSQVTTSLTSSLTVEQCLHVFKENEPDAVIAVDHHLHITGGVYICKASHVYKTGRMQVGNIMPYIVPDHESLDIDFLEEIRIAEAVDRGDYRPCKGLVS